MSLQASTPPPQDSSKESPESNERAILKWHKQDPEQRLGFKGGRYTDANKVLSFLIGLLLTAAFFAVIFYGFRGVEGFNMVRAILVERGPTQYIAVLFFFATTLLNASKMINPLNLFGFRRNESYIFYIFFVLYRNKGVYDGKIIFDCKI